jgi:hypothetical protein
LTQPEVQHGTWIRDVLKLSGVTFEALARTSDLSRRPNAIRLDATNKLLSHLRWLIKLISLMLSQFTILSQVTGPTNRCQILPLSSVSYSDYLNAMLGCLKIASCGDNCIKPLASPYISAAEAQRPSHKTPCPWQSSYSKDGVRAWDTSLGDIR